MTDIRITTNTELMVAHAQGVTDRGTDFVDAYVIDTMVVVDAGRIIVPLDSLADLLTDATRGGLAIETEDKTI